MIDPCELPFGCTVAGRCRPYLRRILTNGGAATYFDGKQTRELEHNRAVHRAIVRLPWPLCMFQPHHIALRTYDGDVSQHISTAKPMSDRLYKLWQMEQAIDDFLHEAEPSDTVVVMEI